MLKTLTLMLVLLLAAPGVYAQSAGLLTGRVASSDGEALRARLQLQITNGANNRYAVSSLFAARAGNIPGQPRAVMVTFAWTPFRK